MQKNSELILLAWCGILAPAIFATTLATFSFLNPNFNNLTNAVSELGMSASPHAFAWNMIGFVLVGLLATAFAWGLRLTLRPHSKSVIAPALMGISGIGFTGLGIFPADTGFAPSFSTTLHFTMVSVNFLPFVLATFIFAYQLRKNEYWKRWTSFSLIMGILAIASFFIPQNIPAGLSQRFGIGIYFLWLLVTGIALLKNQHNRALL